MTRIDTAAAVAEVAAWSASILAGTGIDPAAPVDRATHAPGTAWQAWADGLQAAREHTHSKEGEPL